MGSGGGTPVDIVPGDELDINGNSFTVGAEPVGSVDILNDTLAGYIPGDVGGTVVTVTLGLDGEPSLAYGIHTAVTNGSGNFSITFDQDLGPENFAMLDYKVGGIYQRTSMFPQTVFLLRQNMIIAGYAPRDSILQATVYIGGSNDIRWQGDVKAEYPYGWFVFNNVEMAPGDRVAVDFPGGTTELTYVYAANFSFTGE